MIVLQGFELFPCDGVEASNPPYRLIVATLVVVALIGGIGKSVGCRCQFPTLLHHLRTWCFSTFTCECINSTIRSLRQNETLSTFIVAIMSSNSSDISISKRFRLLRIILCNASICSNKGSNHIRLSLSVDSWR